MIAALLSAAALGLGSGSAAVSPVAPPPVVEALADRVPAPAGAVPAGRPGRVRRALRARKWNHDGGCPDERLAGLGKILPASLGRRDGRYGARLAGPLYRRCARSGKMFAPPDFTRPLDDRNATGAEGFFLRYTGLATGAPNGPWPAHYEYVPGRYVAYWFFYAQSQPVKVGEGVIERVVSSRWLDTLGTHQGDWEHVTIRLDGEQPVEVAFYPHGSPRIVPWSAVEKDAGRPVVYAAQVSPPMPRRAASAASAAASATSAASSTRPAADAAGTRARRSRMRRRSRGSASAAAGRARTVVPRRRRRRPPARPRDSSARRRGRPRSRRTPGARSRARCASSSSTTVPQVAQRFRQALQELGHEPLAVVSARHAPDRLTPVRAEQLSGMFEHAAAGLDILFPADAGRSRVSSRPTSRISCSAPAIRGRCPRRRSPSRSSARSTRTRRCSLGIAARFRSPGRPHGRPRVGDHMATAWTTS